MTGRNLTASLVTESLQQHWINVVFVKLEFDSGDLFVHNGIGTYVWGGDTWLGVGDFGSIGTVEEGPHISPYELILVLSGLNTQVADEALNQDYYLRPITVYMGALDTTDTLVADPDEIWSGKIDQMDAVVGSANTITITCESDLAIFDKVNGKRFSDEALQGDFTGDLLLQYVDQMEDATIVWRGSKNVHFNTAGASGSGFGSGSGRNQGSDAQSIAR